MAPDPTHVPAAPRAKIWHEQSPCNNWATLWRGNVCSSPSSRTITRHFATDTRFFGRKLVKKAYEIRISTKKMLFHGKKIEKSVKNFFWRQKKILDDKKNLKTKNFFRWPKFFGGKKIFLDDKKILVIKKNFFGGKKIFWRQNFLMKFGKNRRKKSIFVEKIGRKILRRFHAVHGWF